MKRYCYSVTGNRVWFKVAERLYKDKIAEPVLWLGDDVHFENATNLFGRDVVLRMLDFVHYQHNIPNFKYDGESLGFFGSENYLRAKDRCIKMIDRLDLYGSYSRIDREAVFNKLAIFYLQKINKAKPDALIVAEAPHSHAQYLMYEICLYLRIKVAKFNTWMPVPLLYLQDMVSGKRQKRMIPFDEDLKISIQDELKTYFDGLLSIEKSVNYEVDYIRKQRLANRRFVKFYSFLKFEAFNLAREALGQLKRYYDGNYYPVNPYRLGLLTRQKIKTRRQKNLINQFNKNVDRLEFKNKFVYFALHYEPERTTNPDGFQYHDQLIALLELRNFLPKKIDIIVKEHPSQFFMSDKGSRGRSPLFYNITKNLRGVKLADVTQNSVALLKKSEFIATISGNVALEAAVLGKKAIIFGDSWFNGCPNIVTWSTELEYNDFSNSPVASVPKILEYIELSLDNHAIPGFQNNSCENRLSKFDNPRFREGELKGICHLIERYLE